MKSPFPGMDPFIEGCGLWEDFHHHLIEKIYETLAQAVPERYTVRTGERSYVVLAESEGVKHHAMLPDVKVKSPSDFAAERGAEGGVALAEAATENSSIPMRAFVTEEFRETFVEISEANPEEHLVTCIEVLSPSNKRIGSTGWDLYQRKRQGLLMGTANLVEIDLLRGQRLPMIDPWPNSPYALLVARKTIAPVCRVWKAHYLHPLPSIPVPLIKPDPDVPLNLQPMIEAIYERSRYARSIDYGKPLTPPLGAEDTAWLQRQLQESRQELPAMHLRPMTDKDRSEVAELIYASINVWYQRHGRPRAFLGGPHITEVYYDVYNALTPGCSVVAESPRSGRIMGSCFYHPRRHHVALGIMNVHPNYFGQGVARALLQHIIDFTEAKGYKSLRLTASAVNTDSFSLDNRAGFVPRAVFQDMFVAVPAEGLKQTVAGADRVRDAVPDDVPAMAALELEVSGITREEDYRYCIANQLGFWHVAVLEKPGGARRGSPDPATRELDGFMISSAHPAVNMLGPCVARTDEAAAALLLCELNHHPGRSPIFLVPADHPQLVHQVYAWGGRNTEVHLCQVRGHFQPFRGISMPTFLPETG